MHSNAVHKQGGLSVPQDIAAQHMAGAELVKLTADLAAKADHARLHTHSGLFITSTTVALLGLVQIHCAALLVQVARLPSAQQESFVMLTARRAPQC